MFRRHARVLVALALVLTWTRAEAGGVRRTTVSAERDAQRAADTRLARRKSNVAKLKRRYKPGQRALQAGPIVTIGYDSFASEAEYIDLRNSVMTMLGRYSPDENFFIGLGRDPTPIMAFLHNLGGDEMAMNFPASGSGTWQSRGPSQSEVDVYFDKLLPESLIKGNRDIVLIDQTEAGRTLRGFPPYIQAYLKKKGFKGQVKKVAFSSESQAAGIDVIDTNDSPIVSQFLWDPYEGVFSEYERHVIGEDDIDGLRKQPEYRKYQKALERRMARDQTLERMLDRIEGNRRVRGPRWRQRLSYPKQSRIRPGEDAQVTIVTERGGESWNRWTDEAVFADSAEYTGVRDVALRLMRNASPRESFYVGIGPGATEVVALLENLGPSVAAQLPILGVATDGKGSPTAQARRDLTRLFDRVIPRAALTGGRDIVLFQPIGYRDAGQLDVVAKSLRRYLRARKSSTDVVVVALSEEQPDSGIRYVDTSGLDFEPQDDKHGFIEPHPSFEAGDTNPAQRTLRKDGTLPARRPIYGKVKRVLEHHMANDKKLAAAVEELFR